MTYKRFRLAFGLLVLALACSVPASAGLLYNNLGQASNGFLGTDFGILVAQKFFNASGDDFLSITILASQIPLDSLTPSAGTLSIYSDDSDMPGTLVTGLNQVRPFPSFADGFSFVRFEIPEGTSLGENYYWAVLAGLTETDSLEWSTAASRGPDEPAAQVFLPGLGWSPLADGSAMQMGVDVPEPATLVPTLGMLAMFLVAVRRRFHV